MARKQEIPSLRAMARRNEGYFLTRFDKTAYWTALGGGCIDRFETRKIYAYAPLDTKIMFGPRPIAFCYAFEVLEESLVYVSAASRRRDL